MSFLQPWLLAALPLAALPIIIHLINQRRFQTVRWAAMMFLLAANRMSRGYARLRQWLIMACRIAAIATLIFVISRPLAGGWLGRGLGGRADTTIVLVDRSPSMQQKGGGGSGSKLETGLRQLTSTFKMLDSARWVVIDGASRKPRELKSIDELALSPAAEPMSAASDIPGMLRAAYDYIKSNKSGRTEIWICSDIRQNDWNADGGPWRALREEFLEFSQSVRFHLLAYPQIAPNNLSVRVTDVRRQKTSDGAELFLSLRIEREGGETVKESVPVQFEIDGARSELTVEMSAPRYDLKNHRIALERGKERGWGKVSIPADANLDDNNFWFVFEEPPARKTIIAGEEPQTLRPIELAASIPPEPDVKATAEVIAPDQLPSVDWEQVALVVWQAPLPSGEAAKRVQAFLDRGGRILFLPPRSPGDDGFLGAHWTTWKDDNQDVAVESWRGDQDLLAHTQSGAPLPVGQLQVRRACGLVGEFTALATVKGGAPLLARVPTNRGAAYFCTTTAAPSDSSFATNGVVLFVIVQRALAAGAAMLGNTRQLVAGEPTGDDPASWKPVERGYDVGLTDPSFQSGVYESGSRLLALNRPVAEDGAPVLADARLAELFRGLDFSRVDDRAGSMASLIQEIWRMFLMAMLVAMVAEAALCLPRRPKPAGGPR